MRHEPYCMLILKLSSLRNVPGHGSGLGGYMSMYPYTSSQQPQAGHSRLSSRPGPLPPRQFPLVQSAYAISDYTSVLQRAFGSSPYQTSTGYVNNNGRPIPHAQLPSFATLRHPGGLEPPNLPPSQSSPSGGPSYVFSPIIFWVAHLCL